MQRFTRKVVALALIPFALAAPVAGMYVETWSVSRFDPGDFASDDVLEWEHDSILWPIVASPARLMGGDHLDACWDVEDEPEESGTTATFYDRRQTSGGWVTDIYPGTLQWYPYAGWRFSFNPANVTWSFPGYVP